MTASRATPASASPTARRHRVETPAPRRGFRPELQGLRALAVGLVIVYHVWIGRVSGGVDVFFVISGFLLAGQMIRAAERGRIDLRGYWGRTARRLLAPTSVVLVVVLVGSLLVLPASRWAQTVREVVASVLFAENWRLAADSVDYYAANDTASVVQHMWSLSIQGQFYLVFPIVVALTALAARLFGASVRRSMAVVLVALTVGSLAYSIVLTQVDQQLAYFHSATRLWEFTAGGLLALVIDRVRLDRSTALLLGWLGVVGLVLCGFVLDVQGGFPGFIALWPVLCAAGILLAGSTGHALGADRWLSSPVMQYLGNISFPLYLWHWPVLLFTLALTRESALGLEVGLLVIGVSVLLAAATRHLVELPLSTVGDRSPWSDHRVAAVLMAPVLLLALGWQGVMSVAPREERSADRVDHPGAVALTDDAGTPLPDVAPVPSFTTLGQDWTQPLPQCRMSSFEPSMEVCATDVEEAPVRRILVIGDSHIQQFLPALLPHAAEQRWQVIAILKGGCTFGLGPPPAGEDPGCETWNEAALREVDTIRPDAVVTLASRQVRIGLTEDTPASFLAGWSALAARDVPVLAVRDNPRYDYSPSECVEGQLPPDLPCNLPRNEIYPSVPSYERAGEVPPNVRFLDLSDLLCTATECPPVIGNVLVYLDNNHLTATYARTMSPVVGPEVGRLMGW